ncbi:MAG: methylenetetrahydrofolate reductase [NAD(P)H] [Candidatus Eremiobacteraeota bacterium]|nr:methylenetetrahydrofolate reductase [NAD(P)H] [Candidatus Eremiobacteraeota bacterium]
MRITEALARTRPFFSFEFFPPRTDDAYEQLLQTVDLLKPLRPGFVSVTYGAGGSTRVRTIEISKEIQQRTGITVMAHLTALGHTRAELRNIFFDLEAAGIENVLALRGDAPADAPAAPDSSFEHANEMIAMLKRAYHFCLGAACYPEAHQQSASPQADMEATVRKVEAGAEFLVTQLFFDNDRYFDFVRRAREAGIRVPILPGLMPITNYQQIARFTALSGATIPPKLLAELEVRRDEPKAVEDLGVAFATLQAADLLRRGAPGIHFYTLNKSPATRAIVSALLAATAWRSF